MYTPNVIDNPSNPSGIRRRTAPPPSPGHHGDLPGNTILVGRHGRGPTTGGYPEPARERSHGCNRGRPETERWRGERRESIHMQAEFSSSDI